MKKSYFTALRASSYLNHLSKGTKLWSPVLASFSTAPDKFYQTSSHYQNCTSNGWRNAGEKYTRSERISIESVRRLIGTHPPLLSLNLGQLSYWFVDSFTSDFWHFSWMTRRLDTWPRRLFHRRKAISNSKRYFQAFPLTGDRDDLAASASLHLQRCLLKYLKESILMSH